MDENPYKAPCEQGNDPPSAGSKSRSVFATLFASFCLVMTAFFLFVFVFLIADFVETSPAQRDWSEAAAAVWGLLNSAMWVATAAATWAERDRLRAAMLFADLFVLLSFIVLVVLFK